MNSLIDACEDMILRGPERSYLQFILSSETGVGYMKYVFDIHIFDHTMRDRDLESVFLCCTNCRKLIFQMFEVNVILHVVQY